LLLLRLLDIPRNGLMHPNNQFQLNNYLFYHLPTFTSPSNYCVNMFRWLSILRLGVHPIRILKGENLLLVYIPHS
jgi:hypothetical protein